MSYKRRLQALEDRIGREPGKPTPSQIIAAAAEFDRLMERTCLHSQPNPDAMPIDSKLIEMLVREANEMAERGRNVGN